jgi:nitroreductase
MAVLRTGSRAEPRCLALSVAILVALSVTAFLVSAFGDALADVGRHLLSVNAMTDLLLAADAAGIASVAASAFRTKATAG